MIPTLFIAAGAALGVLSLAFNFHWFQAESQWAGWVSTACMAAAVACFVIGGRWPA